MKSKSIITASAVVTLVSAWAISPAQTAYSVNISLNTGITLDHAYLTYYTQGNTVLDSVGTVSNGSTLTTSDTSLMGGELYSVIGLYSDSNNGEHVAIALSDFGASYVQGLSFDSTFGTLIGQNESNVISQLQGNDTSLLSSELGLGFTSSYGPLIAPAFGGGGIIMGFSSGTQVGSFVSQAAPEPAAILPLALGALALIKRRRA